MRWRRLVRYDALLVTALVWFLAKFLRYAFPPLFPTFAAEFGVSNAQLGTAYSAMMGVYALMQFPSGALADRVGGVRVVVAGALVAAAGALSLVAPAGFPALVLGMALVGLGTGAHKTVAVGLLSRVYPTRTGRALGVLDTVGAFGGVAAPAAVVAVAGLADWRVLFLAGGLVGFGLAVATGARVPRRVPAEDSTDGGTGAGDDATGDGADAGSTGLGDYAGLFRDRRVAAFTAVTVLVAFAASGVVAFLPLFLTEAAGLSATTANLLFGALFAVSVVQLGTGELGDRVGELPVVVGAVTLAATALGALVVVAGDGGGRASLLAVGAAVLAFGVGNHGYRPVRGAYLTAVLPPSAASGGLGVVRTVLMVAAAIAPAVVGVVADATGFGVAFGLLVGVMGVAAVVAGTLLVATRSSAVAGLIG